MDISNSQNSETPAIQFAGAARRHARYGDDFKRQVVAACQEPDVSTAAIARAHGLNANMVRRWVVQSHKRSTCQQANDTAPTAPDLRKPGFVPVQIAPALPAQGGDIRIELQHERTNIHIHWPMAASSQCAQWLREVLA